MLMKLREFFQTIVPEWWTCKTELNEKDFFFTAKQFLDCIPDQERSVLDWDYEIQWNDQHNQFKISRYAHLDHAAAWTSFFLTGSATEYQENYDHSYFQYDGNGAKKYAIKQALIYCKVEMSTDNDFRLIQHYCKEYVLPHYMQLNGVQNADNRFITQFVTYWAGAYVEEANKLMKALATEPRAEVIG